MPGPDSIPTNTGERKLATQKIAITVDMLQNTKYRGPREHDNKPQVSTTNQDPTYNNACNVKAIHY
jgi:hypothetical protein